MTEPYQTAFPCQLDAQLCCGMNKREYFAAQAMAGILANPNIPQSLKEDSYSMLAIHAVKAADALIVALNQTANMAGLPEE